MATISNTPRPGYVWDSTDNVWYPIGVGAHQHTNAADTPAVIPNALVDAKGDLLTATADNTPARLAVGSNDQVLTADSSTATGLKWATPASGGMTLISTTTLSGASVTLSSIPSTYTNLQVFIKNFTNSTADGVVGIKVNGGSDYAYMNYIVGGSVGSLSATYSRSATNTTRTNDSGSLVFTYYNYAQDDFIPFTVDGSVFASNTYVPQTISGITYTNSASGITSLVILNSGGNWAGGTVYLYGVK